MPDFDPNVDVREQLVNDRRTGRLEDVSVPLERAVRVHGILLDLDPGLLRPGNPLFPPADDPAAFYAGVRPVLDRHPLARHAEVRASGRGLHVLVWLGPAVELRSPADQRRWDAVARVVQSSLPSDPAAPGLLGLTRPAGSVNGKNRAVVAVLRPGRPVEPEAVLAYLAQAAAAPFATVAGPLLGGDRAAPCPVCREAGSRLHADSHVGHCYGPCSRVALGQLFDAAFATGGPAPRRGGRAAARAPGRPGTAA